MNSNKNKVNKNPQFTKVQITQNNPLEFDMSHDNISKALRDLKSLQYYIMGDEIGGKDGTYHTHVYAVFSAPVRFSTLKVIVVTSSYKVIRKKISNSLVAPIWCKYEFKR